MTDLVFASGDNPLTHIVDHPWIVQGPFTILSNHIIMMILAAVILMVLIPRFVRARPVPHGDSTWRADDAVQRLTPRGMGSFIEFICQFLRDYVARPNMGPYTDRFIVYIWSVFFFILTCNLLGLLPLGPITKAVFGREIYGTATSNIYTTGTLAACTLLMIVINGLRLHGMTYVKHFFLGPFPINCLIAVLEVIGLIAKSFALAMRLFANMCAGHILLAVLAGFIAMAGATGAVLGFSVAVPVVAGSVAITLLEIFVAFLQAFIFTFLSCVFIGQAVNIQHHDGHEEHEHEAQAAQAHGD